MKVHYDRETDSLTITLREVAIRESDEVRPGVVVDFAEEGGVVRIEILEASKVVEKAGEIQFAVGGYASVAGAHPPGAGCHERELAIRPSSY